MKRSRASKDVIDQCIKCLEIHAENDKLRDIARDLQWMARRYATGRQTAAPDIVDMATRYLLSIGVKLNDCAGEGIWCKKVGD